MLKSPADLSQPLSARAINSITAMTIRKLIPYQTFQCINRILDSHTQIMLQKLPAIFLNHGGGPMPILNPDQHRPLYQSYKAISLLLPPPVALIVISAHWVQNSFSILDVDDPGLIYDYYGFPKQSYELKYPTSSTKELREQVIHALGQKGLKLTRNKEWKYDHGTFIPLSILYPKADIPVVQISLKANFDPAEHYDLGVKLGELRQKGFIVVGSGLSYHNMAGFYNPHNLEKSQKFDKALRQIVEEPHTIEQNREAVKNWTALPFARDCHPKNGEEHLLPLLTVMGAGQGEKAKINSYQLYSVAVSDFVFQG